MLILTSCPIPCAECAYSCNSDQDCNYAGCVSSESRVLYFVSFKATGLVQSPTGFVKSPASSPDLHPNHKPAMQSEPPSPSHTHSNISMTSLTSRAKTLNKKHPVLLPCTHSPRASLPISHARIMSMTSLSRRAWRARRPGPLVCVRLDAVAQSVSADPCACPPAEHASSPHPLRTPSSCHARTARELPCPSHTLASCR